LDLFSIFSPLRNLNIKLGKLGEDSVGSKEIVTMS